MIRTILAAAILVIPAFGAPGKVVFSTSPINLGNPQNLTTSFKAGDAIYGAVLLSAPIKELCKGRISINASKSTGELKHFIGNAYKNSGHLTVKGPFYAGAKAFPLDVAPEPGRMTAYGDANLEYGTYGRLKEGAMVWSTDLGALPAGTHQIKIEVRFCSDTVAEGEFSIQGNSFARYGQLVAALGAEQTKTVGMSAPKMRDPALEAAMLKSMKASSSAAWRDQILRIVIIDPRWFIERHRISGAILFRYLRAEVAVKTAGGQCSFYQLCTFKQHYVGGKFGPTTYDGHGYRVALPCENVNK